MKNLKKKVSLFFIKPYFELLGLDININLLYILFLTFEALQINSLIIFDIKLSSKYEASNIPNNTILTYYKNYYTSLNSIIKATKLINSFQGNQNNINTPIILICLFITYVVLNFFIYFYFLKKDNYKTNREANLFIKTTLILLYLSHIIVFKILFTPIIVNVLSLIQYKLIQIKVTDNSFLQQLVFLNYENRNINNTIFIIVLSSVVLTLLLFQSIITLFYFNETKPKSKLPWGSKFNYIPYLICLIKINLSIFYVFFDANIIENYDSNFITYNNYIKNFILIGLNLALIVVRGFNTIMNNYTVFFFTVIYEGSFIFNSVISLVNKYAEINLFPETLAVQFIASLFFGLLILNIIDKYHQDIKNNVVSNINSPKISYNYVCLLMNLANKVKYNKYCKILYLGIFQRHRLICINESCDCNLYSNILDSEIWNTVENLDIIENQVKSKTFTELYLDGNKFFELNKIKLKNLIYSRRASSVNNINKKDKRYIAQMSIKTSEKNPLIIDNQISKSKLLSLSEHIYGILKLFTEELLSKNPEDIDIIILYSYINFYYMKNSFKSLFEIMKIKKNKTNKFQEFQIFW